MSYHILAEHELYLRDPRAYRAALPPERPVRAEASPALSERPALWRALGALTFALGAAIAWQLLHGITLAG